MTFNPDLPKARRLPKSLVTPARLPFMRAIMRAIGFAQRRGRRIDRGATGQRIWVFPARAHGPRPAVLWVHGGGLVFGNPASEIATCKRIVDELDFFVASPEYRFAPKDPYPAALDDVTAALDWLAEQPEVDPTRIAIGGDSGGGHLAAALAIRARDRGGPHIAFQCLHEPMLDEATRRRDDLDPDQFRVWSPKMNARAWDGYVAALDTIPATASPARLDDASGLPATFIGVGSADLFHDECRAYAETLRTADVPVEEVVVPGAYHGFAAMEADSPVSQDYMRRMIDALRRALTTD